MIRRTAVTVLLAGAGLVVLPSPAEAAVRCAGHVATIVGTSGPDRLVGTPGRDVIAGLGGDDSIRGLDGRDVVCGGPGNDELFGGEKSDTLGGGPGLDVLSGGRADDVLRSGPSSNRGGPLETLQGDEGDDLLISPSYFVAADYQHASGGVTVDLVQGFAEGPGVGRDTLRGPRFVFGSWYDDTMIGSDRADILVGAAGKDDLRGGGGLDNLIGFEGADTLDGGSGIDFLQTDGLDVATGGPGPDTFFARGQSSSDGGTGQDFFEPIAGHPSFEGGAGAGDTADLFAAGSSVTIDLAAGTVLGAGVEATVAGTEWAFGSSEADEISGDDGPNYLFGGRGGDTINGRGGDDTLDGDTGRNILDGGEGTDQCSTETLPRTSCESNLSEERLQAAEKRLDRAHALARGFAAHTGRSTDLRWLQQWVARR